TGTGRPLVRSHPRGMDVCAGVRAEARISRRSGGPKTSGRKRQGHMAGLSPRWNPTCSRPPAPFDQREAARGLGSLLMALVFLALVIGRMHGHPYEEDAVDTELSSQSRRGAVHHYWPGPK